LPLRSRLGEARKLPQNLPVCRLPDSRQAAGGIFGMPWRHTVVVKVQRERIMRKHPLINIYAKLL